MDLDDAYANGPHIAGAEAYPPRWARAAAAFRGQMAAAGRAELDLPYGPHPRMALDLFHPDRLARGLVVFIHGGYWRQFDKSSWSHLAAGPVARGWAVAMPSYVLTPEVRLPQITAQIVGAVEMAATRVPGPVRISGHSAGGQMTARMGAAGLAPACAARIARLVPISPLSDLRPMTGLAMNRDWGLDAASAAAESPVLAPPPAADVHVWVGGDERPVFLEQARWLAEAWQAPLTIDPGRHHFDVIDGLADPESPLCDALLG